APRIGSFSFRIRSVSGFEDLRGLLRSNCQTRRKEDELDVRGSFEGRAMVVVVKEAALC
ncbi:hypothetical protein CCACVL1_07772, partial [Corchorus capsularis]